MADEVPAPRARGPRWWWWAIAIVGGVALMIAVLPKPPPEPEPSETELRALIADPQVVANGRALFAQYCVACHGQRGEGAQGPNLRDEFWIKGSDMTEITHSIAEGNPVRGMVAWKTYLKPVQIHVLAAYVASLHGSEDGTGKTAEGRRTPIAYWPPSAAATSTPAPAPGPAVPPPPAPAR